MVATYEDAELIVQLMRWGTEMGLQEALSSIFDESIDHEDGSSDDPAVQKVLFFGETVGTLVKHDVLDRELLVDLLYIDGIWKQVRARARHIRESSGVNAMYENFEALLSADSR